jgi:FkbM family methyltransferase
LIKVRNSLKRDGYILDVGANIGLIGIPAAMIMRANSGNSGEQPSVVCIEAVTDNQKALRHTIFLNSADSFISVIGTGLGEKPGVVEIQVEGDLANGEGTGTANILPKGSTLDPNGTYQCVSTPIQITTLDILSEANTLPNNCTLVKIDTDGYDLKILEGGRDFLIRNRPVVYGEFMEHCLNWHGQSIEDVVKFAHSIDYVVWHRQAGKSFKFTDSIDLSKYIQDALLVPIEHTHALAWCCE